jgi:hypothetical protein
LRFCPLKHHDRWSSIHFSCKHSFGNLHHHSCRFDRLGELGRLFLALAVTVPYSYFSGILVRSSALRQVLPLRRAKKDDRVRPYYPMNGLYIRAVVVALLGGAATF